MLIRHYFSIFLLSILLSTGLAACQGEDSPAAPAETQTVAPTATAAPTSAPTVDAVSTEEGAEPDAAASPPELADILTIISRAEGLELFAAIAQDVGLAEELSGEGPYTIILPTTAALDELPPVVRADLALMETIIREHIAVGSYALDEMTAPATIATFNGNNLSLMVGQTGGTIHGANVLGGDFEAQNGIIHVVDTVLLPESIEPDVLALYEPVAGEELQPMQGNSHIANNEFSPITYRSTPPTSGPHYPNVAPWQLFDEPWRYEQLIHNLEDAGVVIYYQCADGYPELVQQLRELVEPYIASGRHVLVAPNDPDWTTQDGTSLHRDMGAPIAVTAWRRLLKLDEFDADQINAFIEAFEGIDHHVK